MIGLLYIAVAWLSGYVILKRVLPSIFDFSNSLSLTGKQVKLPAWMVTLPASFLVGTLLVTWTTYISAYLLRSTGKPMLFGNIVSFSLFSIIIIFFLVRNGKNVSSLFKSTTPKAERSSFLENNFVEIIYVLAFFSVWAFLMFDSFHIENGIMKIAWSVSSDFSPHLAVIRSFSYGFNFPTEYPHFADGNMRYHFMFLFLAGNLEFLGLRLDWAFNLPSILAIVSFLMLLYSFAVLLLGEKIIGVMTGVLFFFRSSFAFFTFITGKTTVKEALSGLGGLMEHIGNTQNEEWGLYAQKVYVNQRHLSFALGIMMLVLIVVLPLFIKMMTSIGELYRRRSQESDENPGNESFRKQYIKEFVSSKSSWIPENMLTSVIMGIILGLTSFWNGAVVIAALLVLFVMAIFSKHRLQYLIIALITVELAYCQTAFFVRSGKSLVSPTIYIGFLANTNGLQQDLCQYFMNYGFLGTLQHFFKLIPYVAAFFIELLGIFPFIIGICLLPRSNKYKHYINAGFIIATQIIGYLFIKYKLESDFKILNEKLFISSMLFALLLIIVTSLAYISYNNSPVPRGTRALILAFTVPIIFASTVKLTLGVDINHKYVIIGSILLNIFVAAFIFSLFKLKRHFVILMAVLISIVITATGFVDIVALCNLNNAYVQISCNDPLLVKVKNETGENEIFLTDDYHLHTILLAGRKIFCGWAYFTMYSGYDWDTRNTTRKKILTATDESTLRRLVEENNISYIVIDNQLRNSKGYRINEDLIRNTFELFYDDGMDVTIYKVN
ncbi:MAG TPA: hypothetical protein PLH43_11275 [Acetivibrio sp.]|uniref:hypothetical protein n=1 Tax=Acetivibrio sp. TaxID=1872092 RepID=UPI002CBD49A2|nr:hypothetical protein [Acetivibrio sp.]HOM03391.1 hypothetical protein [Acetivibrio sp.]